MISKDDIEAMSDFDIDSLWEYYSSKEEDKNMIKDQGVMDMVKEFAEVTEQEADRALYETLIIEEYGEWLYTRDNTENELKELADLVYVIYGLARVQGWDLDEAIRRVHLNNLSRVVQPDGSVKRREDGKILKRKNYPKVDLGDLV
jgi:predicted HAD superfamily Cof-like phosphohydrolase